MAIPKSTSTTGTIKAPNFAEADIYVVGTSPLVIHRFSTKTKLEMKQKMEQGKSASSRKTREPKKTDDLYEEARYRSAEGWDGFHAGAMRRALISACRLVGFRMTLAKLSVFVVEDGWDKDEPQIPLCRIYGTSEKLESMARVETGQPYVTVRAAFYRWKSKLKIRFDADQFTVDDVINLTARVGAQVGLAEGRYDSKASPGLGWGCFEITDSKRWNNHKV